MHGLSWSPDGKYLVLDLLGKLAIWDFQEKKVVLSLDSKSTGNRYYKSPQWSISGDEIAVMTSKTGHYSYPYDLQTEIYKAGSFEKIATLEGGTQGNLGWADGGKVFLTDSPHRPGAREKEGTYVYDAKTWTQSLHDPIRNDLMFALGKTSAVAKYYFTEDRFSMTRVFDLGGKEVMNFEAPFPAVSSQQNVFKSWSVLSDDGALVVYSGMALETWEDGTKGRILKWDSWNIHTHQKVGQGQFTYSEDRIAEVDVALSRSGKLFAHAVKMKGEDQKLEVFIDETSSDGTRGKIILPGDGQLRSIEFLSDDLIMISQENGESSSVSYKIYSTNLHHNIK